MLRIMVTCAAALGMGLAAPALAQDARFKALADLPFTENRPTPQTASILHQDLAFQQAVQAYLWAMPLINTLGMMYGSEERFGSGYNVLPIWKQRLDTRTLITTPNSDVLYAMSYIDMTETGPIVMEAPPRLQGILLDFWQRPIPVDGGVYFGDVGFAGPDQGKGGKFLILPPGYKGDVPEGYYVYRSGTRNLFVFLRGFFENPDNLAPAVAHLEQTRIYPLNLPETARKAMVFPDASGVPVNMLPRSTAEAFDQLKWLVDKEGEDLAGPDGLGILASIGLVAGMPFAPDSGTRAMLDAAATVGYKTSRVIGLANGVGDVSYLIWPDRQWVNPINNRLYFEKTKPLNLSFRDIAHGFTAVEPRVWYFTNYYSISPGMVSQVPGQGAAFQIAFNDASGTPLSGDATYKLTLPKDIPARLFWSLTLYEAANGSGLATRERKFPSLGSHNRPVQNADGTTDLWIGPKAPKGREANWLPTAPGRGFFAILRLYGPEEPAINLSWKPGDFEKID